MISEKIKLSKKYAQGYCIPLGSINLVFVHTDIGMLGCGAFDIHALDKFSYPAAKVKTLSGDPIIKISDIINGVIKEANRKAQELGINEGMPVADALEKI